MKKLLLILIGFILLINTSNNAVAQDIHFSQFFASPLSLNPAETGFFEGNWRFSNIYRTQWSAIGEPFKTIAAGIDKPFNIKNAKLGLGLMLINDQSGSSMLTSNNIYFSVNYIKKFAEVHQIAIAFQVGYVVKSYDLNGLTFPSQYNGITGLFDSNLDNNLAHWRENLNFSDINIGINYSSKIEDLEPKLGISIFHINKPAESFLREENHLPMRASLNAGLRVKFNDSFYSNIDLISMHQKKAQNSMVGGRLHYVMPENSMLEELSAGVFTRTAISTFDAMIFYTGFKIYDFEIGISYDINVSSLVQASNMRGAFEISIIYKDISKTLNQITLPCDRF